MAQNKPINSNKKMNTSQESFSSDEESEEIPCNVIDWRKAIKSMEQSYKQEKRKRIAAEEKLLDFRKQSIIIKNEFHAILEKYKAISLSYNQDDFRSEIEHVYEEILTNFQKSNNETHSYLEQKYQGNYEFMMRKINQIVEVMTEELRKQTKVSKQEHFNIVKQIKLSLEEAMKIEDKNKQLCKKIKQIEFSNKVLKQEKALLVNQILDKKKIIQELSDKVKCLEDSRNGFEDEQNIESCQDHDSNRQFFRMRPKIRLGGTPKSGNAPFSIVCNSKNNKFYDATTISNKTHMSKPQTPSTQPQINFHRGRKLKSNSSINNFDTKEEIKLNFNRGKHSFRHQFDQSQKIFPGRTQDERKISSALEMGRRNNRKYSSDYKNQSYEKTIEHLKKTIDRQKKKVIQLQKIVSYTQLKNKDINQLIQDAIQENEQILSKQSKKTKNNGILETLLKSQKLFESLKLLKKRLGALESPLVSCGWGDYTTLNI